MNLILLLIPIFIFIINSFFKKNNLINNYKGKKHQKFIGKKNIPLTGGIFLSIFGFAIFYEYNILFCIFLLVIFFIGLISDTNFLSSPQLRFLLQSIALFALVYFTSLQIFPTRLYLLDIFLENIFFSYLFTTFCLMIVVNGSNFIDGLNGLVLSYYLMISLVILKFKFFNELSIEEYKIIIFAYLILCLLIFNIFDQLYIGDNGSYLLGYIFGFLLISIYQNNQNISPFFIILLLWYPSFENLFSIIRKFTIKKSPIAPDNKHLHQLLFNFMQKKFRLKNIYSNNLSSLIIVIYNFLIFNLASIDIYNTQYQILFIIINISIYVFVYIRLFNFNFNIKLR